MITSIPNLIRAWPLVAKRSIAHWRLLLSVIIGVFLASTIMAGTVVYFDALREFALKTSLGRLTDAQADLLVRAERGPTSSVEYAKVFRPMTQQIDSRVEWLLKGRERGGKSATFFLTATGSEETAGDDNSRAYFAFLDGLPERITLLPGGRMPVEEALSAPGGPLVLEAIIPDSAAQTFGVGVGDSLSAVPHWDDAIPYARVVISGVFQRDDPDDPFWRMEDEIFRFATAIGFRTVPFFLSEGRLHGCLGGRVPGHEQRLRLAAGRRRGEDQREQLPSSGLRHTPYEQAGCPPCCSAIGRSAHWTARWRTSTAVSSSPSCRCSSC